MSFNRLFFGTLPVCLAAPYQVMRGKGMKWEPTKINFLVLMSLIGLGLAAAIIHSWFTPTLDECRVERVNEDIGPACWEILSREVGGSRRR